MEIRESMLNEIDDTRARIKKLLEQTDVPAIYQCLKIADMNLHWAKWLMGDIQEIIPELELEAPDVTIV